MGCRMSIIFCTYLVLDKSNKVVEEKNKANTSEKKTDEKKENTKKEENKEENEKHEIIVNDETNFEDQNIYVDKLVGDVDIYHQ